MSAPHTPLPALDFDPDALRERYRAERDRRIRPDGNRQYRRTTGEFGHFDEDPYAEPGFTREPLRDHVDAMVEDPATAEKLKPWYRYMCKRHGGAPDSGANRYLTRHPLRSGNGLARTGPLAADAGRSLTPASGWRPGGRRPAGVVPGLRSGRPRRAVRGAVSGGAGRQSCA